MVFHGRSLLSTAGGVRSLVAVRIRIREPLRRRTYWNPLASYAIQGRKSNAIWLKGGTIDPGPTNFQATRGGSVEQKAEAIYENGLKDGQRRKTNGT